jgi:hypothetical protein
MRPLTHRILPTVRILAACDRVTAIHSGKENLPQSAALHTL